MPPLTMANGRPTQSQVDDMYRGIYGPASPASSGYSVDQMYSGIYGPATDAWNAQRNASVTSSRTQIVAPAPVRPNTTDIPKGPQERLTGGVYPAAPGGLGNTFGPSPAAAPAPVRADVPLPRPRPQTLAEVFSPPLPVPRPQQPAAVATAPVVAPAPLRVVVSGANAYNAPAPAARPGPTAAQLRQASQSLSYKSGPITAATGFGSDRRSGSTAPRSLVR
jgi:hypothetical protein